MRDGLAQFMEREEKLCFYKLGDKNARRAVMFSWRKSAERSKPTRAFLRYVTGEEDEQGPVSQE